MRCLCCGKEIKDNQKSDSGWHVRCIKTFFGTSTLPQIEVSEQQLEMMANEVVNKGLTVPGVQKKMSLHLSTINGENRLTVVNYPTGYILKPQSPNFELLPEAEFLSMQMAEAVGIKTVPFALIQLRDAYAYITKRVDRTSNGMLAMEDFCQLDGRLTADKYKGSYEECGRIIKKYSKNVGIDLTELFLRLIFCFVSGNSDMHLKNFSLLEGTPGDRVFGLSPAYDLLPVNVVMPADKDFTALTMNGKKRNQRKNDFFILAENYGINKKTATAIISSILKQEEKLVGFIKESYISDEMKETMILLMKERMSRLI